MRYRRPAVHKVEDEEAYDSLPPLPLIPGLRRVKSLTLVPSAPEQRVMPDQEIPLRYDRGTWTEKERETETEKGTETSQGSNPSVEGP